MEEVKNVNVPINMLKVFGNKNATSRLTKEERCMQEINNVLDKYDMQLQILNDITVVPNEDIEENTV